MTKAEYDGPGGPTPEGDARWNIIHGLNDTYTCEWSNTDFLAYAGRGSHWFLLLQVVASDPFSFAPNIVDTFLTDTEGDDVRSGFGIAAIDWRPFYGPWGLYMNSQYIVCDADLTHNQIKALGGTATFVDGDRTYTYITDPSAYVVAASALGTWSLVNDHPASIHGFDELAVSVS
jgi:hypothetical protein